MTNPIPNGRHLFTNLFGIIFARIVSNNESSCDSNNKRPDLGFRPLTNNNNAKPIISRNIPQSENAIKYLVILGELSF